MCEIALLKMHNCRAGDCVILHEHVDARFIKTSYVPVGVARSILEKGADYETLRNSKAT